MSFRRGAGERAGCRIHSVGDTLSLLGTIGHRSVSFSLCIVLPMLCLGMDCFQRTHAKFDVELLVCLRAIERVVSCRFFNKRH